MCVLAFAWNTHSRWRLVMVANRDEYHGRPAAPLARWEKPGGMLAGRDLLSGGTWLGVAEQGRLTAVTNLRGYEPPQPGLPSRGALVTALLRGDDPEAIPLAGYNPVNLIVADRDHAWFLSNRPQPLRTQLAPGLYGLSNGTLDEPWPKTLQLKSILLDWLMRDAAAPEMLLDGLREETLPDIGLTPQTESDIPQEPNQSPIFIRNPLYGTRCSSVVAIDRKGQGLFIERRYASAGEAVGETSLSFSWPA